MVFLVYTFLTWIGLIGIAVSLGLLLFRLPLAEPSERPALPWPDSRRLLAGALALLALSSVGEFLFRASEMSGTPLSDVLSVLSPVLQETHYGTIWLVRIACLVLLIVLSAWKQAGRSAIGVTSMMALVAVVAWTQSASGHAAQSGHLSVREVADLIHLLSVAVWSGGVLVLAFVILPSFRWQGDLIRIAAVTRRFSHLAGYAVVLVLVTALYNIQTYIGEFGNLWKTPYGLTVLAKMVLLYFLLLIGALNRYLGVPLLEHAAGARFVGRSFIIQLIDRILSGARGHLAPYVISIFRRIVTVEAVLMLVLLLCAALLRHETPPRHIESMQKQQLETQQPAPAL